MGRWGRVRVRVKGEGGGRGGKVGRSEVGEKGESGGGKSKSRQGARKCIFHHSSFLRHT